MNSVQTSVKRRRFASSVLLQKKLTAAFALEEQLPCLVPLAQRRARRQSEKNALRLTQSEKAAQVAMFQLVM